MCQRFRVLTRVLGFLLCFNVTPVFAEMITFGSDGNQFSMEFVQIGSPGNAAGTTGSPNPAGSVGYTYSMGVNEVSRDMVAKANNLGGLGITLQNMTSLGGNGVNRPATGTSWNEASRFVNWLNTTSGFSPAYNFAAQPGEGGYSANANLLLWQPGDPGYDAANPFRNSLANYVLPTADEWYKAAYFDPTANGGAGGYNNFATGSDTAPAAVASGTVAGTAVYGQSFTQGPADVMSAGGLSPLGTMGQSGNILEWEESATDQLNSSGSALRGFRGGVWTDTSSSLQSSMRGGADPMSVGSGIGFRVASLSTVAVPEPSSILFTLYAAVCGLGYRGRRR